jgi:light-regulated signal transduction histidine kinase (bacteriophytochrome)
MNEVVQAADHMHALIRDLLTYAKTVNAEEIPATLVDTRKALEWALNNLQVSIQESGVTIETGEMPVVTADQVAVVQLFQNLISNAIKYRGSKNPWIRIGAKPAGNEYVFTVADNGIGIAPQYHKHIFELFKRLHTRNHFPGTGIGLTLCKKIVEKRGGKIWVESQEGQGSSFHFTLPGVDR